MNAITAANDDEPKAMKLANLLETVFKASSRAHEAAWELRRQHAEIERLRAENESLKQQLAQPIDMVLHCPACGKQHIDGMERVNRRLAASDPPAAWAMPPWNNPPHRSHLCHGCGHIWRPADVPTNGVLAVKTKGRVDSPLAAPQAAVVQQEPVGRVAWAADVANTIKEVRWATFAPPADTLLYTHPAQQANPVGWLYDWTHSSALGKPDEHFTSFTPDEEYARKHSNARPVFAAAQQAKPQPIVQRLKQIAQNCDDPGTTDALDKLVVDLLQKQAKPQPLSDEQWQAIATLLDSYITRKMKDGIEKVLGIKE